LGDTYKNALKDALDNFFLPFEERWKLMWINNEREAFEALQRLNAMMRVNVTPAPSLFPLSEENQEIIDNPPVVRPVFEAPEEFPEQEYRPRVFAATQLPTDFREAIGALPGQNIQINVDVHDNNLSGTAEENSNLLASRVLSGIARRGTTTAAPLI
jgi:hypothetical protein